MGALTTTESARDVVVVRDICKPMRRGDAGRRGASSVGTF
jgi:hypothetical protein